MADQDDQTFGDAFCETLGISVEGVSDGSATAKMTVTDAHLNFAGVLHGGAVFSLADATAGAAMESLLDQDTSTALESNVSFLSTVERGETVVAEAKVTHESRKTSEVSVTVETEDGTRIASYRCRGYKL